MTVDFVSFAARGGHVGVILMFNCLVINLPHSEADGGHLSAFYHNTQRRVYRAQISMLIYSSEVRASCWRIDIFNRPFSSKQF